MLCDSTFRHHELQNLFGLYSLHIIPNHQPRPWKGLTAGVAEVDRSEFSFLSFFGSIGMSNTENSTGKGCR
jgi:hypothetical protein